MTIVDMHALCLLAVPIGTAVLAWRSGIGKPDLLERGLWALAAGVAWFIVLFVTTALTPWYPFWQWATPGICLMFAVVFIRSDRGTALGAIAIAVSGIVLIEHAWSLRPNTDRIQRVYYNGVTEAFFDSLAAKSVFEEFRRKSGYQHPSGTSEGWLEAVAPEACEYIPERYLGDPSDKYGRRWHSWLTGLLEPVGTQRLGIWITSSGEVTVRAR